MTVRAIPSVAAADERAQIRWILEECRIVAVVGLSSSPYKDSYIVAHHLHRQGYDLVPINPKADAILGRPVFRSLSALPAGDARRVQLVLIFRPSDEVPQIVDAALAHLPNLQAIWMQKGIVHEAAAARAREAGLIVVADRCIRTQHLFTKFG
ncbi:MAG TPA: CoA-binding protein [bacterium]